MSKTFVHLHLHSEYSLVDSTLRLKPHDATGAAEPGMPAIAVTDQFNLFALVKFYRAAGGRRHQADCRRRCADPVTPTIPDHPTRLVLLCQNRDGYLNLCQLLSRGYLEGQHLGMPYLQREWLSGHSDGLIALSGAREGDIGQALLNRHRNRRDAPAEGLACAIFPDRFYIELQRTGRQQEAMYEAEAICSWPATWTAR